MKTVIEERRKMIKHFGIPIAITKYLFSTKEDKNITDIILHTQEHDTTGRQWALEFKKIADEINGRRKNSDAEMKRDDRA